MAEQKEKIEKSTKIKDKVQWHPAFVAALKLEMREYAEHLHFESEHVLNQIPRSKLRGMT